MELHIVLTGPRCAGKTSTGVYLASALNAAFIDADPMIELAEGKTIEEFARENGWEYFRRIEAGLITKIVSAYENKRAVFAPGGGAVAHEYAELREQNIRNLRSFGKIILLMPSESLEESAGIIYERMKKDKKSAAQRPSLTDLPLEEEVLKTLKERLPFYMQAKDYVIYTKGLDEREVARKIIKDYA